MAETETVIAVPEEELSLRSNLEKEYSEKLTKEVEKIREELTKYNKERTDKFLEDLKKKQQPPTVEEIQTLLDQEYVEFTVKVRIPGKNGDAPEDKAFTIRELPQAIEKKAFGRLKTALVKLTSELEGLKFKETADGKKQKRSLADTVVNLGDGDLFAKVLTVANAFEPMLDVLAYAASLVLNPFNEEKWLTEQWVRENMSSARILKIVSAQAECNRMRDFFSLVSRELKSTT